MNILLYEIDAYSFGWSYTIFDRNMITGDKIGPFYYDDPNTLYGVFRNDSVSIRRLADTWTNADVFCGPPRNKFNIFWMKYKKFDLTYSI